VDTPPGFLSKIELALVGSGLGFGWCFMSESLKRSLNNVFVDDLD
jgi:hypothetical protein